MILLQARSRRGVLAVRLGEVESGNRYAADVLQANTDEDLGPTSDSLVVVNLAEPPDARGQLPAETDCLAFEAEGLWLTYVRPCGAGTTAFPARVVSADGGPTYTVREQSIDAGGAFGDAAGSVDVSAINVAERSLGPGGAVDEDTIVLVTAVADTASPPTVRYLFSHPPYAKYLD